MIEVRILRRPHSLSHLMPGDRTFFSPDYAARAVKAGVVELVAAAELPTVPDEPEQRVDPNVDVLNDNPEMKRRRDQAWKSPQEPTQHKMVTTSTRKRR